MKKYFVLLAGLGFASSNMLFGTSENLEKYAPENTVIAYDFHEVIAFKPVFQMLKKGLSIILNADNRWDLVKLIFSPTFICTLVNDIKAANSTDRVLEKVITQFPGILERHKEKIYQVANMHYINPEMVQFVKQLKNQGYKQVLASNIGPRSLALMKELHPEIFELFDGLFFDGQKDAAGNRYSDEVKPHAHYYTGLRKFLSDQHLEKEHIIFIDDKKENIEGARKAEAGIDGIQFLNPAQLRKKLEKRGISLERYKPTNMQTVC